MVWEELSTLVRKLAKSATAPKNDQKRDKEKDKPGEPSSKQPYAKKPKVADISSSLNHLDNKGIADTRLSKLMSRISKSDEYTKFQLTEKQIVSLMIFFTAQCIAKLAHLAAAAEVEEVILVDDDKEDGNHSIGNKEADDANDLNEPKANDLNEPNAPNEPNNPNGHQNVPHRYMHSFVSIANQELELSNSHAFISRSYLS
jgi:hypothetical protein